MGKQEHNNTNNSTLKRLTTLFFYLAILFFIIGFNFSDTPTPFGWYQQFLPTIGNRQISDIFFLDSLTGWAVTPFVTQNDTTYVLKTTNGGDNWFIQFVGIGQFVGRNRIYFLNANTGFTCGNDHFSGSTKITKTTNGGNNWFSINDPTTAVYNDMSILNEDTIWLVANSSLTGGVFLTTNGGVSWQQQFSGGTQNPDHIYMYNARIGFISKSGFPPDNLHFRRTTDGGQTWPNINNDGFLHMYFIDSLAGWKCTGIADSSMKKTTDGGLTWAKQILPYGGNIITSAIGSFSVINRDTLWGGGGFVSYGSGGYRGMLCRTTNGGNNWLFQVPDTAIHISGSYVHIQFIDKKIGWAYSVFQGGIHTTNGGDTIFLEGVQQVSSSIPKDYKLYQNYPNPFNPVTNIKYQITNSKYVLLSVYDITGKHIIDLVNQKQQRGTYQVDFSGNGLASGVYFYSLIVEGNVIDTKKMILLK
jgi:photosystem II stability/assembly factor-like uncharacterized protein